MPAFLGQSNSQPFVWGQWGGLNTDSVATVPFNFATALGGSLSIPVDFGSFPSRMATAIIQSMLVDNTMNPGVLTVTVLPIGQSFSIGPFSGQIVPFPAPGQRFTLLLTGVSPNSYTGQIQLTSMNWQPTSWAGAKSGNTSLVSVTTQIPDSSISNIPTWTSIVAVNSKRVQLTVSLTSTNPYGYNTAYSFDGSTQAGVLNIANNPPGPTAIFYPTTGPGVGQLWVARAFGGGYTATHQTIELSTP
jgi:hypothetical protein